jgi:photosystem II stability/assembly factor-like uncharacterized protein
MTSSFDAARSVARSHFIVGALALVLTACGGGGSSTPEPTALPAALTVSAPATRQSVGGNIEFSTNGSPALGYQWSFGDGTTSTSAKPSHTYASAGIYMVTVSVTNEAGAKAESNFTVTVSNTALVQGKLCNAADGNGWCWQRPLPQGNAITSTTYVSNKHGWAVGEYGTILTTADGGTTWTAQKSGTDLRLNSVSFSDANNGWIGASGGMLLRTIDGGQHWAALSTGYSDGALGVTALDANTAWLRTYSGVLVTADAGAHWKAINYPGSAQDTWVASAADVWVMTYGGYGSGAVFAHTTDGGATWNTVNGPGPSTSGANLYWTSAKFVDATHGWLAYIESTYDSTTGYSTSRQIGYRTTDAGASWQAFDATPFAGIDPAYLSYGASFQFVDANTALARSGYNGSYRRSVDGGVTWQPIALPSDSYGIASIQAVSADVLQAQSYSGTSYISFDAGAHWDARSQANQPSLNSVWFFDAKVGMAIADDGSSVRTTDGGLTWTTTTPTGYYGWRRMQFLSDASVGWVISSSGTIYRSTDKGQSWLSPVPQSSPAFYVNDFHFIDANNGWAVSGAGTFYRTTNGGSSWELIPDVQTYNAFSSIRFADATHGVAVGPSGVAMVTSDAGVSWQPRPTNVGAALQRVTFIDANTAVAVGDAGAIARSTDRGQTWTRITSPTTAYLRDVRFLNAKIGTAVGSGGTIVASNDGGLTWSLLATGAQANLSSVFFTDEETGWVVGDNGTILVTATAGR